MLPKPRARISAGLLFYRQAESSLQVLLVHPGGPLFKFRDAGYWSIPKGEIEPGEELLAAAIRECQEEVGLGVEPSAEFLPLGHIRQKGGKLVHAWGVQCTCDIPSPLPSNVFPLEWPPHSGRVQTFPEVDRAVFFPMPVARTKIKETQIPLLERLDNLLAQRK